MEKTQGLSALPYLFDWNELLNRLSLTPEQLEKARHLIYLEGLSEKEVLQKVKHARLTFAETFGVNDELKFICSVFKNGCTLCLINGDNECFKALFFQSEYFPPVKTDFNLN